MFIRTLACRARKKGGLRGWTPNTGGPMNSTPGNLVSPNEGMLLAYRPLPKSETVEHEEDFFNSTMGQREYYSQRSRDELTTFHDVPLVYSNVELKKGQETLATVRNRYRSQTLDDQGESFAFEVNRDKETGALDGARYIFNESRMRYCEVFCRGLHRVMATTADDDGSSFTPPPPDDPGILMNSNHLTSVMEVCAMCHGNSTIAQESILGGFGLDRRGLENQCERQRAQSEEAIATVEAYNAAVRANQQQQQDEGSRNRVSRPHADELTTTPTTTKNNKVVSTPDQLLNPSVGGEVAAPPYKMDPIPVTADTIDFMPLYASYIRFASGGGSGHNRGALPSHDPSSVADRRLLSERLRWRRLIDLLINEDYHQLSLADRKPLETLNDFFFSHKYLDLKVGESVREIVARKYHDYGGGVAHSVGPTQSTPSNPSNRRNVQP